ncbi:MAG: ABC transporter ATP-binding protein [Thermoplasmatota archaeon]
MAAEGLDVQGLHFTYPGGGPAVLQGASLSVPAGASGFLLGPSGCGKSTLLRCVAGLERDYQGTVSWAGASLDDQPPHRRPIGLLFQDGALFPHLRAWQNVAFPLRYRDPPVPRPDRRKEAERWLELVGLAERAGNRVDELSGGQRQRIALARTLAARPSVVLLDEPFASLDRDLRDRLGPEVKELLADQGVASLWVTHDEEEARRLGDQVWRMAGGRAEPAAPGGT